MNDDTTWDVELPLLATGLGSDEQRNSPSSSLTRDESVLGLIGKKGRHSLFRKHPGNANRHFWSIGLLQLRNISHTKRLALHGALWTFVGFGSSQVLRFIGSMLLTRMLFPELFGLMTLVNGVLIGLQLFSDIGLGTSIIRSKQGDDPKFLNRVWTLIVLRGLVLWLGCAAIAFPMGIFYEESRLFWLVPLMGFTAFLNGLNSTFIFTLYRRLALRELTVFELTGHALSLVVMLTWAYLHPSIWALVAGSFTSSLFQLVWSHRLNPGARNHFDWDWTTTVELFSFGKWIFVSTLMTFLAAQADKLIIGKLFSLEIVGIYGIAVTLATIPYALVSAISNKVFFPSFSSLADVARCDLRAKIERSRLILLLVAALGMALIVGFGDLAVSIMYDQRYTSAVWMMPLLAIGTWPFIVVQTVAPALLVIGKPEYIAAGSFLAFATIVSGLLINAINGNNLFGAVVAVTLGNIPFYIAITWALKREKLAFLLQDFISTLLFCFTLMLIYLGRSLFLPPN